MYQHLILDHYRRPRNRGTLAGATSSGALRNATCGDEVAVQIRIEDGVIAEVRFQGEGCSISQAATSMMTVRVAGTRVEDALALADRFAAMLRGDEEAGRDPVLGDLRALAGVARFPVRVRCALLGFDALREALKEGPEDQGRSGRFPTGDAPPPRTEEEES